MYTTYHTTQALVTFVVQLHSLVVLFALLEVHGALDHQRGSGLERVPKVVVVEEQVIVKRRKLEKNSTL